TVVLICCLTFCLLVPAFAQSRTIEQGYAPIELKAVAAASADLEGRRVTVTAEIVSVNADARTLNVFDAHSKTLVSVSLVHLSKSQRQALIAEPIVRVSVFGRIELKNGRAVIKADQVMPLATNLVAQR
ncbi:MAG TPA: hypothetical protein PKC13_23750, partial [Blastocatellia bacterium]|nr:hypothetical protein [Blastocatellia bacterium]